MKYNSGSITTNSVVLNDVERTYTLRWGIKSLDAAAGTSTIGFSLRCNTNNPEGDTVDYGLVNLFNYSINVNGTPVNWGSLSSGYSPLEDGFVLERVTYSFDDYIMQHDDAGAATLNVELIIDVDLSTSEILHFSGSNSWELPITKTSYYLDVPDAYIGETATINVHYSGSATWCTIAYEFGGFSGNVTPWETFEPTITWEIPPEFYYYVANTSKGYGLLTCTFYNNMAEVVMTSTATFGVMVRQETNLPVLNPIAIDTNPLTVAATGDNTIFVKHCSDVKLSPGAAAQNGADIVYQEVTYNTNKVTALVPFTLEDIENPTFTFKAIDSRGFTSTTTVTSSLLNYIELTCHISKYQLDAVGSMIFDVEGNYFNSDFIATDNTLTIEYRYRDTSNAEFSEWIAITPTIRDNTYAASATVEGLEYGKIYELEARAIDKVSTVNSEVVRLVSKTVFDWGENDFRFTVPVKATSGVETSTDMGITYDATGGNIIKQNRFGMYIGDKDNPTAINFHYPTSLKLYSDELEAGTSVNLISLVNALTTSYELDCTTSETYKDDSTWGQAILTGNYLYVYFGVEPSSSNWTGRVTVTHDGKIKSIPTNVYAIGVNKDDEVAVLCYTTAPYRTSTTLRFDIKQQSTTSLGTTEMVFVIPVVINPDKYV